MSSVGNAGEGGRYYCSLPAQEVPSADRWDNRDMIIYIMSYNDKTHNLYKRRGEEVRVVAMRRAWRHWLFPDDI